MRTEDTILSNLIYNEEYTRQVIAFLKEEYFHDIGDKVVFELINRFLDKYNACPSKEALLVDLSNAPVSEGIYKSALSTIENLNNTKTELTWILDTTEKWCQDRALHNSIHTAIKILDNSDDAKSLDKGAIPGLLQDALGVSFDTNIGHDFFESAEDRYEFYHNVEEKIPFDIEYLNKITKGGLSRKSLNILMAGCVHPSTPVKIRYKKDNGILEKEVPIIYIKQLLSCDIDVEVWSPDGWVWVESFVDKGEWEEYACITDNGYTVLCNENHLFKTTMGWLKAKEIYELEAVYATQIHVNTEQGFSKCRVEYRPHNKIPIVDIQVISKHHRYYTNNIESHNTGVGKSLIMCHCAAANLMDNKNVLYITMEMSEEKIAERIDANLLNIKLDDLEDAPKDSYLKMVDKLKNRTMGKLIIKEYPTSSVHAGHFRHLLNELKTKKNFIPHIIYIDYINICASSRIKGNAAANSYTLVKAVAEEIRALAVEFNVPIVSATQSVRAANVASDMDITDISESFGLAHTGDCIIGVISTEELEKLGQYMFKQIKNRYADKSILNRFVVGVDKSKMKLYDIDSSGQTLIDDSPVFDKTPSGDMMQKLRNFK